jgi:hypothetical protein|tara:strand:- start:139 stop:360 length:222 start_codon:yes stop_codon:yes gene_type:complete
MVVAFLLVVVVDGEVHNANGDVYWNSIVTCSHYANWIESTAETWQTPWFEEQIQIQAYCVPQIVNPEEVKVFK